MLVLPIINKDRILNVEVRLKNIKKLDNQNIDTSKYTESNIYVGLYDFNNSSYNEKNLDSYNITLFIRNSGILKKNKFIVTTKSYDKNICDFYEISYPNNKISDGFDRLYGEVINDIRNKNINEEKGHYLDFKRMGITDVLNIENINKLEEISLNHNSNYSRAIKEANLMPLLDILKFIDMLELNVIEGTSLKVSDYNRIANKFIKLNTKDTKSIYSYYNIASNNKEIYSLISRLYYIINNRSMEWINNPKTKIKENKNG